MFTFIKAIINKSSLFYKCIPLGDSRFLNHLRVNMVVHFKGVGRFAQKWTIFYILWMQEKGVIHHTVFACTLAEIPSPGYIRM